MRACACVCNCGGTYAASGVAGDEGDLVVAHGVHDFLPILRDGQTRPLALDLEYLSELQVRRENQEYEREKKRFAVLCV
jgi:hypothetical protein